MSSAGVLLLPENLVQGQWSVVLADGNLRGSSSACVAAGCKGGWRRCRPGGDPQNGPYPGHQSIAAAVFGSPTGGAALRPLPAHLVFPSLPAAPQPRQPFPTFLLPLSQTTL